MKKTAYWYTQGSRPERNAQAAVLGGTIAFVDALSKGKPRPWLYAMTGAAASASAMNEHRLTARARANARANEYAEAAANVLNKLFDMPPALQLAPAHPPSLAAEPVASPDEGDQR